MTPRATKALAVLKAGGYFRKQLESTYRHGEQFKIRLRDASGQVVAGIAAKTFYQMEDAGLLQWRQCERSSVWPSEWTLKEAPAEIEPAPRVIPMRNTRGLDL